MSSFNELMRRADNALVKTFNVDNGVTLFPDTPQEITVRGVYDAPFSGVDIAGGRISSSDTCITLHDIDCVNLKKRDTIKIIGTLWTVREMQPDGTGLTDIYIDPKTTSENSAYSKY
ncbi:head-tail joining protein [Salmonella enterica]|uniref:head-tail joining protein n=1 Tax=Salmonella enterica TaxID=28901 RepID=UPI0009B0366D|nr:head-tail joining protein [Salmonella enterica]